MEVTMGLFVESIASDGLVYCYDPIQYGEEAQSTSSPCSFERSEEPKI